MPCLVHNRCSSNCPYDQATVYADVLGHAKAPTFYLSSDSAGEPPHGFIGGIVFTSASHLKGKRHGVSFNLQQDTKECSSCVFTCVHCVHCVCTNSFFYLDKVFGPSCPQDTATAISQSVPSILSYFTTVGVGTSVDNQLKYQRIYFV